MVEEHTKSSGTTSDNAEATAADELFDGATLFNRELSWLEFNRRVLDEAMKEELPEKHWDNVLRSAIRKTKVTEKELAFNELKASLTQC